MDIIVAGKVATNLNPNIRFYMYIADLHPEQTSSVVLVG
jgi:hypothetical protein